MLKAKAVRRELEIIRPYVCHACRVMPGPEDPLWGLREKLYYQTDTGGGMVERVVAHAVSLPEVQVIYVGIMNSPLEEFEVAG